MSTTILDELIPLAINSDVRLFTVNSRETETLPDYVRRVRNEKDLSTADVEKRSGFGITDGYVSRIENGYIKNVSPEKLKALARGLGVPEDEVFAVARGWDHYPPGDGRHEPKQRLGRRPSPAVVAMLNELRRAIKRATRRSARTERLEHRRHGMRMTTVKRPRPVGS